MKQIFTGSETIAEIVTEFPGAANLFRESRIDFCCGGGRTLSEALQKTNLDESRFCKN